MATQASVMTSYAKSGRWPHPRWGVLGGLLLALLAATDESLWLDEGSSAFLATRTTLRELWQQLRMSKGSEAQMPGYIGYLWLWVKVVGSSEWALRLSNVPWLVALYTAWSQLPIPRPQRWLAMSLVACSPFVWYNLDEARPTIVLICIGGMAVAGVLSYLAGNPKQQRAGIWLTGVSVSLGLGVHLLMYFLLPALLIYLVLWRPKWSIPWRELVRAWWVSSLLVAVVGGVMLFYYVGTLQRGAGGVREMPTLANLAFVGYEWLGFGGLGPPREAIKMSLDMALIQGRLPYLIPLTLCLLMITGLGLRLSQQVGRHPLLVSGLLGLGLFALVARFIPFQFWGRHAAFFYPFFLLYLSGVLLVLFERWPRSARWLSLALLICWGVSSGIIRLDPTYQKRGAREAIAEARTHISRDDMPLMWTSNWMLGCYYGLDFMTAMRSYPDPQVSPAINALRIPTFNPAQSAILMDRHSEGILIWFNAFANYDADGGMKTYIAQRPHELIRVMPHYRIYHLLPYEEEGG